MLGNGYGEGGVPHPSQLIHAGISPLPYELELLATTAFLFFFSLSLSNTTCSVSHCSRIVALSFWMYVKKTNKQKTNTNDLQIHIFVTVCFCSIPPAFEWCKCKMCMDLELTRVAL